MKKIFLFNGPPGSGKDYAAEWMASYYKGCKLDKFARVLKERTHALYGFPWRAADYYEDCKNEPNDDFFGLSPRQAYINVSETYFKVHHGSRIFGQILAQELDSYDWEILAISDSGFKEEAQVLVEKYGAENIILVRIHREGHDFSKDSRSYINLNVCNDDIVNLGDETYIESIKDLVDRVLANKTGEFTPLAVDLPSADAFQPKPQPLNDNSFLFIEDITEGKECTKTFKETQMEIEDYWVKTPVPSETFPDEPNKVDEDAQVKDYVFEDVVDSPSFLTRLRRLIGIK